MQELMILLLKIAGAILIGLIGGNGAVYVFNRIPPSWLCDYGETPDPVKFPEGVQRVKSYPWKWVFSMVFVLISVWLLIADWLYAFPAIFAIWTLLELALADKLYMILPDQFILMLGISAIGFLPFHVNFLSPLLGALLGGGALLFVGILGKLIFKKESLGFGDVKLFAMLGLCVGPQGAAFLLIATSLWSALVYSWRLLRKKIKKGDYQPMADNIAFVSTIYLIFSHSYPEFFKLF